MAICNGTPSYKDVTKKVENKVKWLKNKKLELEADALNTFANKRQVDELFRRLKSDNSTFLDTNRKQKCDSNKLKEHFKRHFNIEEDINEPFELNEALLGKWTNCIERYGLQMVSPNLGAIQSLLPYGKDLLKENYLIRPHIEDCK